MKLRFQHGLQRIHAVAHMGDGQRLDQARYAGGISNEMWLWMNAVNVKRFHRVKCWMRDYSACLIVLDLVSAFERIEIGEARLLKGPMLPFFAATCPINSRSNCRCYSQNYADWAAVEAGQNQVAASRGAEVDRWRRIGWA